MAVYSSETERLTAELAWHNVSVPSTHTLAQLRALHASTTRNFTAPVVSGARDETEGAMVDLLNELEALGLISDTTTAS